MSSFCKYFENFLKFKFYPAILKDLSKLKKNYSS